MFETKNSENITNTYLAQTATYLGDRLGRLGFLVSRKKLSDAQERKAFAIFNDSNPRKVILGLSDTDFVTMLRMKCDRENPMRHLQTIYRNFRTRVQ